MRTPFKKYSVVPAALAGCLVGASPAALAVNQGDWLVRVGAAHVSPNDSSGGLTADPSIKVGVDSSTGLGLNLTYMVSPNIGVEVLGALPFKHDITGAGSLASAGKIAETKQLPPTVVALYNFAPKANVRPYAGIGINYTTFFSEKTTGALSGVSLKLDDSWGLAGEVGVDVDINKDWFFNASVWYMDINTTAKLGSGLGSVDVQIDPWAFFVGVGTRF